jgi:hypothetical protein
MRLVPRNGDVVMPAPTASDFDPAIERYRADVRAGLDRIVATVDEWEQRFCRGLGAMAALLEDEAADADEAVGAYLKTSEGVRADGSHMGPLAGGGSEEPASCRSLAGPGSDSKSDAAGIDTRGRRCASDCACLTCSDDDGGFRKEMG